MKVICYPEGGLKVGVFSNKGQQLKYAGKVSTHTSVTLRAIPLGVLKCLAKLTSIKPKFHYERVENVYPDHSNSFHEAGLAPPIS